MPERADDVPLGYRAGSEPDGSDGNPLGSSIDLGIAMSVFAIGSAAKRRDPAKRSPRIGAVPLATVIPSPTEH